MKPQTSVVRTVAIWNTARILFKPIVSKELATNFEVDKKSRAEYLAERRRYTSTRLLEVEISSNLTGILTAAVVIVAIVLVDIVLVAIVLVAIVLVAIVLVIIRVNAIALPVALALLVVLVLLVVVIRVGINAFSLLVALALLLVLVLLVIVGVGIDTFSLLVAPALLLARALLEGMGRVGNSRNALAAGSKVGRALNDIGLQRLNDGCSKGSSCNENQADCGNLTDGRNMHFVDWDVYDICVG